MRSPEQQFALAKGLPISELAKVMQGQSDVVDMSIAQMVLREKTRAQKMMQGAAAQQQAQAPSVAEKDLMDAGIGAMPVDVDVPEMAGGGIVAFASAGQVGSRPPSREAAAYRSAQAGLPPIGGPRTAVPTRSMFGRMLGPVGTALTYGYDSLFGTSDEELGRLKAFDEAKDILKQQGLTDKDIGSLSTEDIFGAAQAFGYKGQRGVPVAQATKGITDAEKALAAQAGQIEAGKGPNAQMGIAALEGSPQSGRVPGLSPQTVAGLDALGTDEASATVGALAKQVRGMRESLAKPSLEATDKEVDEMYKKAGVSLDPYAQYKKDLEAEGKSDAEARKEAGWMRALEAGLGIMGGESPYAFTNIGKGAQAGLKGYGEDIKEFRKAAKDRTKAMADIAAAENSLKKGITDAKIQRYDRAKERYDSASMKLYEIDATLSMEKAKLSVAKGAKVTEVALKEANDQIQKEMAMNPTLAQDPTAYQARLDQLYRGFVSALQGGGVTTGSGVPAGVKVTKK